MIGTLWAVASAATAGTIATDKSFVSSDTDLSLATRSVEVTVTDSDLNEVLYVGEGPGEEDADIAEVIIVIDDATVFEAFDTPTIDLSTSSAGGVAGVYSITLGTGVDEADILPTVDRNADGAINESDFATATPGTDAGAGETNIGSDEIIVTRVANAEDGRIQLEAQDDLSVGDRFALRFATSSRETTVVSIEGDDPLGTFTMALLETDDASSGEYEGSFVAADSVTLDIGDINGEQFAIAGGSADEVYEDEEITVAAAQAIGDAFNITVTNSPIRDTDDDDNLLEELTPESGSVIVTAIVSATLGTVTVQALQAYDAGDTFEITYNGSRQVEVELAFAPAQDTDADLDVDADDVTVLLPASQTAGLLQMNEIDGATGEIRFGLTDDVDTGGTVVAISYNGAESQASAGTAEGASEDIILDYNPQDLNGDDAVTIADITILGDWTASAFDGVRTVSATRDAGAGASTAGDAILIQYGVPAPSNPQNALAADPGALAAADRPVIQASDSGRITIGYDDGDPVITVEAAVDVESDLPSFDTESPTDASAASDVSGSLSIEITDAESGVDTDTVEFSVSITGQAFADATKISGDDVTTTVTDGTVAASVSLDDVEDALDADFSVDNLDVDLTWWVEASDDAGNSDITDSDSDTAGDQAYTVNLDTAAPSMSTNVFTGDWWNADDEQIEGDRRLGVGSYLPGTAKNTSIRIEFSDDLDGDTVAGSDFTVDGVAAEDALHFDDSATNVFLVVAALDPDATPEIELTGVVSDSAGNAVATGTRTAADGIAPTATISVSAALSDGDVDITVTTDEDIRTPTSGPRLYVQGRDPADGDTELAAVGDGITVAAPTASRTTGENEWSFSLEDIDSTTYTVLVEAEDRDRNRKTVGEFDPDDDDAVSFEIDTALSTTVDGDASVAPVTSPADGATESLTDIFIIEIDWPGEDGEYPLDSNDTVSLTKAVLNEGEDDERNLLAADVLLDEDGDDERTLTGEDLARTDDNIEFTIDVPDIGLGDHTLTFNAEDDAGNSLAADAVITFTVETSPPFELTLSRGINMVSLPGDPADGDINTTFGDVEEVLTIFTRGEDNRTQVAYRDPANPDTFIGNLDSIDATRGYGIEVSATVTVEIDVPALDATSKPPRLLSNGGEWSFVPVISLLPVGSSDTARVGEIVEGSLIAADAYLGSDWDIA